nr:LLM class flavin-dependent oxidoreductase [Sanguibacter suaedae]
MGSGWNREEMRNHGVGPTGRTARMVEAVQAVRQIWATDESEFHGDHVDFAPLATAGVDRCLIPVRSEDSDDLSTRLDALVAVREAFASR